MVTVRVLKLAGAIIALAGCCHSGQLTQSAGATTAHTPGNAELVTLERKWVDAVYGRDSTTLSSLESEDFVAIIPSGSLDKAEQLRASTAAAAAAKSSPAKPPEITIGQQLVSLYGDVAVITDKITLAGGPSNPVSTPGTYWQTEVWRYQNGAWKMSRLHISPVEHGM